MERSDTASSVSSQDGLEWATCLTLLPSILVVLFLPAYIYHNMRRLIYSQRSSSSIFKTGIAVALTVTEAQVCFLSDHLVLDIPQMFASCLCLGFFCLATVLHMEHHHIFQAINLAAACLAVDIIYDGLRVFAVLSLHGTISPVVIASICQKTVIILMETARAQDQGTAESSMGSFFRVSRNQLRTHDLPELDDELKSTALCHQFRIAWESANKAHKYCLWEACLFAFPHHTLGVAFLRFLVTAATFSQPLLMKHILQIAETGSVSLNTAADVFAMTTLVYGGIAASNSYFNYVVARWALSLRGGVGAFAVEKSMLLKSHSSQSSRLITVVSDSIHTVDAYALHIAKLFGSLIDTLAGIALLYQLMGILGSLILGPFIFFIALTCCRGSTTAFLQKQYHKTNQTKIKFLSYILPQFREIKIIGIIPAVYTFIQNLHTEEVESSKAYYRHWVNSYMLFGIFEKALPLAILGTAVIPLQSYGANMSSSAFPPLALATLLVLPMMGLPWQFTMFFQYIPPITTLQEFFLLDEHVDPRAVIYQAPRRPSRNAAVEKTPLSATPQNLISMSKLSILSLNNSGFILENLNATIQKGQLNMIVGSVGCGKSLLVKALLGEVESRGSLCWARDQTIAYCAQDPWLQNRTIRSCITSIYAFDPVRYNNTIRACGLEEDLLTFENGDLCTTGSMGNRLSGGQKHRIALARAVYSEASILVLDDVFSSIDRVTARVVFGRLFGKDGLVRQSRRTTILSTHSAEYLPEADQILAFGADGTLSNCESFFDLASSAATHAAIRHSEDFATDESNWRLLAPLRNLQHGLTEQRLETTGERSNPPASSRATGVEFLRRLLPRKVLRHHLLFTTTVAIIEIFPAVYAQLWIENSLNNDKYLLACVVVLFVHPIFHAAMYKSFMILRHATCDEAHRQLLSTVTRAHISSLTNLDHGSLLSRFVEDMLVVKTGVNKVMQSWLAAARILLNLGVASFAGAEFAIATQLFVATAIILQQFYRRIFGQAALLEMEAKSALYSQILEMTTGLSHIRAFQWQQNFKSDAFQKLELWQRASYFLLSLQRWFTLSMEMLIIIAALLVTSTAVSTSDSGNPSRIAIATFILMHLGRNTCRGVEDFIELDIKITGITRMSDFIDSLPPELDNNASTVKIPAKWPSLGELCFTNVNAMHRNTNGAPHIVLKSVSFKLKPGQRMGIVGRTGSGKTSLSLSVLNSISFTGNITLDGIDIAATPPEEIRRRVTTITQHPVELPGTVRDNILPSLETETNKVAKVNDHIIFDVLRDIGLLQHINEHGGIDAEFSAMKFSQGQKQLLSLARAILHHRQIGSRLVIIDEATSNMDYDTDSRVQSIIQEAFKGCTMLIIAHRVETLRGIDYLLELDGGKVAAILPCSEAAGEME